MNFQKLIIGGIVGGIVYFLLGWLFYGLLFADLMAACTTTQAAAVMRPMEEMYWPGLIAGNLVSGFLMAYFLLKANITTLMSGAISGGILGFLMCSSFDLIMYGTTHMIRFKGILLDVAIGTLMAAIVGGIVAAVIGRGNK